MQTENFENNNFAFSQYNVKLINEKNDLRRTARLIGIPLLCTFAISLLISTVIQFFGFSQSDALRFYNLLNEPMVNQIVQIVFTLIIFLLPFTVSAKVSNHKISKLIKFEKPKGKIALPLYIFGVVFCIFANISVSYAGAIFEGFGVDYSVDTGAFPSGILGFTVSFIAVAIIPGLIEEYVFRGIILGMLRKYGDGFAIIVSSALFGIIHGNFEQMPFAFLVGIVLGFVCIKTESIWICSLIHLTNNAVSVIFDYLQKSISNEMQNVIYCFYMLIILLLGIFSVIFFIKGKKSEAFEDFDNKKEFSMSLKKRYTCFFSSPFIIIFAVLYVLDAFLFFK